MPRGIPNQLMLADNRTKKLDPRVIPLPAEAVRMYEAHGGHITEESHSGQDPLANDAENVELGKWLIWKDTLHLNWRQWVH